MPQDANHLNAVLDPIAPDVKKWASVIRVTGPADAPAFAWQHYRDSEHSIDFWPASVIKLYTCVAACEKLNALRLPLDVRLDFLTPDGRIEACAMFPEMCSNIFRESTNDDYAMLLRFLGIDAINTGFFTAANGFTHTALMRGYVHEPPHVYDRALPQHVVVTDPATGRTETVRHTWSGTSYSRKLGAHILDADTGNCSTTRDMAECLRRVMFHEVIPPDERFDLTPEQLTMLREGRHGTTGLANTNHAWGWKGAVEEVFPDAGFYHKSGDISTYYLQLAYVHDEASNTRFVMAVATESGTRDVCRECSKAIAQWA